MKGLVATVLVNSRILWLSQEQLESRWWKNHASKQHRGKAMSAINFLITSYLEIYHFAS